MTASTRAAAARALAPVIAGKASLRDSLPPQQTRVGPEDRALLQQLCYGSLRHYHRLEAILNSHLRKPFRSKDTDVHALLICGLYQLLETRVPDHAALATTVEACRTLKKNWATGLVNGVLRNCLRAGEDLENSLSESQRASHPQWLFDKIEAAWPAQAAEIFEANNQQPPMYLRANRQVCKRDDYLKLLEKADIAATPTALSDDGLLLEQPMDINALPGFSEGLVSVQDEAAQLSAGMLNAQQGHRVLDACSAPGGKACHILETQPGLEELVAADIDSERLQRVEENLERLNLQASICVADASNPPADWAEESFDRILIDAPCSGTGVIRRHPDIKLLRRNADMSAMADLQLAILKEMWPLLKPGGELLYVTCSILPQENDGVVSAFLQDDSSAASVKQQPTWGQATDYGVQLLPSRLGPDGLYFARMTKN